MERSHYVYYPQNIDNTYYVLREMFAVATIQRYLSVDQNITGVSMINNVNK